jgi:CDP-glucose 4,6-dehydratase
MPGFWRGRCVLVRGHTGFKDAWLTLRLHALGAEVYGFVSRPPTTPSLFALTRMDEIALSPSTGDVRELAALEAAVGASRPRLSSTWPRKR